MKTAHINQIIETKQDPCALIAYHLDSNISFPIFKTSEKTLMSQNGKTATTITELFCTKCNEHFVQHGDKCNNPTCPNCGNVEDSFHPYANTDINENTMFSDDINVSIVDTVSGLGVHRTSLKNIKIANASAHSRRNNSRSEIAILSKEQIDGETIFVMRQYELFLHFDVESNKRECILLDTKNMLLFAEKEIINIREGRRSSASVAKSWSHYYYQTDRVFLTTHDLYIDLQDRVKTYFPNSKLNPLSCTNLLDVYTYSINA